MLELKNIATSYGGAHAISGISLSVRTGSALALLGRNGAGKTTTLKSIMGLLKPDQGEIIFNTNHIIGNSPDQIAQIGIGYIPEDRRVFASLTVTENLETARKPGPDQNVTWGTSDIFNLFPEIARRRDALAGTLSGGEQQMLSIARALMGNPILLLLDEPSEGLAPVVVNRLGEVLLELRHKGVSMILSEQNQRLARNVCRDVLILETGTSVFTGQFDDIDADPMIIQNYLGI